MTTPLYSLGAKLFALFAGAGEVSNLRLIVNGAIVHFTAFLYISGASLVDLNLSIFAKGTCCCTASHLPLGVTNKERDANLSCIRRVLLLLPARRLKLGHSATRVMPAYASLLAASRCHRPWPCVRFAWVCGVA